MNFDWLTLADYLVFTGLLYLLFRAIQAARAWPLVVAVVALAGLLFGIAWAGLPTTNRLLSNFLVVAFLVVFMILYQNEIRRGLGRLSQAPLAIFGGPDRAGAVDDLVLACGYFAQHRIGALIALERETSLRTYIESGIALDAQLSYDLLVSIFLPGSPLHDGAVILQKNRVAAASCFLPLSLNPPRLAGLGTRHRAALGVTEESDAIAIVVSEQTGAIGLMSGGALTLNLTPDQLRGHLNRLLRPRGPQFLLPGSK